MVRRRFVLLAAVGLMATTVLSAAQAEAPPSTWGKLVRVKARDLKEVYLLPGADFRGYTKVMLDPAEVDFVKGWVKQMNSEYGMAYGETSDADAQRIAGEVRKGVDGIFAKHFAKAGYQVVTAPGPDVLRLSIAIFDLSISAPGTVTMAQGSIRTVDAGQAALLIEARDSPSGQVLGRALDAQVVGQFDENMPRSMGGNQADFEYQFDHWAAISIKGLEKLKAMSPVDSTGAPLEAAAK